MTKTPTVQDATMGYKWVRKGAPCPVPCVIQDILTDSQLICHDPSRRICPRHHHRAEKLIEPGTKKPLVSSTRDQSQLWSLSMSRFLKHSSSSVRADESRARKETDCGWCMAVTERCRSVQDPPEIQDSSQGIAINVRKPSMLTHLVHLKSLAA